jgi:hypothetical protein
VYSGETSDIHYHCALLKDVDKALKDDHCIS